MKSNSSTTNHSDDRSRAEKLLGELNAWEIKYGNRARQDPNYDVPGEAVAKIEALKEALEGLGYVAKWNASTQVYELRKKEAR